MSCAPPLKMSISAEEDGSACDIPPVDEYMDGNPYEQNESIDMDEHDYEKNDNHKGNDRYQHPNEHRPMRPRHQGPMHYRYRSPYSQGFRGRMSGNQHSMPYMRPNRNGPQFDNYGPPMGMSRPPRHFKPRYQSPDVQEENMDGPMPSYSEINANGEYDGPPNMPPGMHPRGPPPYMMGPHGGPPHNAPLPGPHGGPYGNPPGPPFSSHGPPMAPPTQYNSPGPLYTGTGQPHPPFPGPHQPGSSGPGFQPNNQNFGGPPHSSVPEFNGPPSGYGPPPNFGGPFPGPDSASGGPPMPPFSAPGLPGIPPGPPAVPPPVSSGGPPGIPPMPPGLATGPSGASGVPPVPPPGMLPPASPGNPSVPTSTSNAPLLQTPFSAPEGQPAGNFMPSFPSGPPMNNPPLPPDAPSSETQPPSGPLLHPMTAQGAPAFPFPGGPPVCDAPQQFPMPMGFPSPAGGPRPIMSQPPIPPTPNVPLHMMPPPMPHMSGMPPSMPPYGGPMHFMPPTMQLNPISQSAPHMVPPKPTEEIWVENLSAEGKAYYYNMRTRETRWDRPEGVTVVRQGEVENTNKPSTNTSVVPVSSSGSNPSQKPLEVTPWTEYHNPEGKAYYHNSKTGETTWEKPEALINYEDSQKKTAPDETAPSVSSVPPESAPQSTSIPSENVSTMNTDNVIPTAVKSDVKSKEEAKEKVEVTNEEKENQPKTPKDSSRPVSSTAVQGTPWCVVWTGDGRAFFFNPSQRLSVWERPEELKGRADVSRLLEKQTSEPSANDDSATGENSNQEGETAAKKARIDEDASVSVTDAEVNNGTPEPDVDMEKNNSAPDKIPVGMEAAKEAEERAARERAVQPLEVRVRRFREMLIEMQVSAFSTWEKELHKIVFDPRYLLLASKERKQTFEAFVKERADEERREKKSKLKERKEKFNELLAEATLNSKSSFGDFSAKFSKDDRFKGIEKSRERESLFQDFISELRKKEKEEKHREKEKVKLDFIQLLKEHKSLSRHSHWSDIKKKIDSDPRYKAVDSSSRREDWFKDYVKKLDETTREDSSSRKEREKKERQEASMREREREVKDALSSSMKDRDKEREQQLHAEQEQNFKTLLVELIRESTVTWKEAKKLLRKDDRWEMISDVLQRAERDVIFKDHIEALDKKRELKGVRDNDSLERRSTDSAEREENYSRKSKNSGRR